VWNRPSYPLRYFQGSVKDGITARFCCRCVCRSVSAARLFCHYTDREMDCAFDSFCDQLSCLFSSIPARCFSHPSRANSSGFMLKITRYIGIGFIATIALIMCGWIGNHSTLCTYLTSPSACPGRVICWGGVIGVAVGTLLLGLFLATQRRFRSFVLPCFVAVVLTSILFVSHMIQTFCF